MLRFVKKQCLMYIFISAGHPKSGFWVLESICRNEFTVLLNNVLLHILPNFWQKKRSKAYFQLIPHTYPKKLFWVHTRSVTSSYLNCTLNVAIYFLKYLQYFVFLLFKKTFLTSFLAPGCEQNFACKKKKNQEVSDWRFHL